MLIYHVSLFLQHHFWTLVAQIPTCELLYIIMHYLWLHSYSILDFSLFLTTPLWLSCYRFAAAWRHLNAPTALLMAQNVTMWADCTSDTRIFPELPTEKPLVDIMRPIEITSAYASAYQLISMCAGSDGVGAIAGRAHPPPPWWEHDWAGMTDHV